MNTASSLTTFHHPLAFRPSIGEVYADGARPELRGGHDQVWERARAAQKGWARVPLAERVGLVQEGIRRLNGPEGPHRRGAGLADGAGPCATAASSGA
jgi:hypothetical protein